MKPAVRPLLLLIIVVTAFTSCKKSTPKQTKFIPRDASFVAIINTKSIQDKLLRSQLTLENLINYMQKDNDTSMSEARREWEAFTNAGIDLQDKVYISTVTKTGGNMMPGGGSSVHTAIAGLEDAAKLEAYIKKKEPTVVFEKGDNYNYAFIDDNMVAWGREVVLMMSYQQAGGPEMEYDSTTQTYSIKPGQANSKNVLKAEMNSYFNLKQDATVGSIQEFQELTKQKADAGVWINSGSSLSNMPLALTKLKELTQNSYTAATINFEDDKVVANTKSYASKALGGILEKHSGAEVNLDLIRSYPSNDVNAFALFAFKPELFNALVRYVEVGAVVDGYLTRTMGSKYTLHEALKAFSGHIAIIASDFRVTTSTVKPMGGAAATVLPNAKVLVNAPVGDKEQLNKMLNKLVEQNFLTRINNEYKAGSNIPSMGVHLSINDKNFLISTDSAIIKDYQAGSGMATINTSILNVFEGKQAAVYIDLEKTLATLPATDSSSAKALNTARETFRYAQGYVGQFNGKYTEGTFELHLKSRNENSLATLIKLFASASGNFKRRSRTDVMIDTLMPQTVPAYPNSLPEPRKR